MDRPSPEEAGKHRGLSNAIAIFGAPGVDLRSIKSALFPVYLVWWCLCVRVGRNKQKSEL